MESDKKTKKKTAEEAEKEYKKIKKIFNPKSKYIQKRFFKNKVNGQWRSLAWNKNVYREWFRFAQLSPLSYPKAFGDLSKYSMKGSYIDIHERDPLLGRVKKNDDKQFEKWWKEKKDLFYEPLEDRSVTKIRPNKIPPSKTKWPDDNHLLYLQVDLRDTERALIEYHKMIVKIQRYQDEQKTQFIFESKAKFHPSIPQKNIKLKMLMIYRYTYDLFEIQKMNRKDIAIDLVEKGWLRKLPNFDEDKKIYLNNKKLGKTTSGEVFFEKEVKHLSFFLGKARKIFQTIKHKPKGKHETFPEPYKDTISDSYDDYAWHWPSSE